MKIKVVHKRLPFFTSVCDKLKENRLAYCQRHNYEFVENTDPICMDKHWSFTYVDAIIKELEQNDDVDWICHMMPAFIIVNYDISLESLIKRYATPSTMIGVPYFKMFNPDNPYYYTDLTGEIKRIPTNEPTSMLAISCAFCKKDTWTLEFLKQIRADERFTRGVFANAPMECQVSSDAFTIYYFGYPEYRKHITLVKATDHTRLPMYGYPKHLLHLGSDMQVYKEGDDAFLIFVVGCGIKPENTMEIIDRHWKFIK